MASIGNPGVVYKTLIAYTQNEEQAEPRPVCVVQNLDKFTIRNLPDFNISKGESFANWNQRFTDMIDVICDDNTTEAGKVDILKVRLTGSITFDFRSPRQSPCGAVVTAPMKAHQ
uniref:C2 domain-containing protein n=1 Tax=Panagrellus redivivus TaxID=6233 RepID=A0A7E4VC77_PANRE